MSSNTKIEWTDATLNILRGCSHVSDGCRNCYAEKMAARFSDPGQWGYGIARRDITLHWTGKIAFDRAALEIPGRWRKPRRVFLNSVSDTFHPDVTGEMVDSIMNMILGNHLHTFQMLTKRAKRMHSYFNQFKPWCWSSGKKTGWITRGGEALTSYGGNARTPMPDDGWPLDNLWLGVSVENQKAADERIPYLLDTPATLRFISVEPMLGPVDIRAFNGIGWVICGGETGPGARPMNLDWAWSLRDQCADAGVPFFFKSTGGRNKTDLLDGRTWQEFPA